jgi:hypothetical protein
MAETPEFKRQETLQPATSPLPFGQAGRELGQAGNFLSAIGSDVAIRASVARAERAGVEFGKDPSGDLLPALNKTDEAFQTAYRNTALQTLSVQGDKLLSDSLTTISSANKLSPELIGDFRSSMDKGIEQIVSQAPLVDQEVLRTKLNSSAILAQGKLEARLIKEQKEDLQDTFATYAQQASSEIFDIASVGEIEAAKAQLEIFNASVRNQVESGLLSKLDGESLIKSTRITFLTGREFAKAMEEQKNGNLDTFLSEYGKKPPEDMTPSEWVDVGKNLLQLVQLKDSTDAKNQSLLVSEGNLRIAQDDVDAETILRFQREMSPTNFNNFLTQKTIADQRKKDNQEDVQFVLDNWGNAGALANVDRKALEKAFQINWQDIANKTGVDAFTAKTLTAAGAATPITSYINELNAMAINGTPEARDAASRAIKTINQQNPGNLQGLSSDAENYLTMFDQARTGGQDIVQASETATKAVLDIDKAEQDRRKEQWTLFETSSLKNNKTWGTRAKLDLGLSQKVIVDDEALGVAYKNALKSNYLSIGNIEAAKTKAIKQIMSTHDVSKANGKEQFLFKPIERVLNITEKQLPFVYSQMAEQVKAQVNEFNKLYESGQSDFKYVFKEGSSVSFEEYNKAKEDLKKALEGTNEFRELILGAAEARLGRKHQPIYDITALKSKIASYEEPGLPQIERVYRHGEPEVFSLNIYASDLTAYNGMQVYNVMLQGAQGDPEEFIGANALLGRSVFYIPNETKFREDYLKYIESSNSGDAKAVKEMQKQFDEHKRKANERIEKDKKGTEIIVDNSGNIGVEVPQEEGK